MSFGHLKWADLAIAKKPLQFHPCLVISNNWSTEMSLVSNRSNFKLMGVSVHLDSQSRVDHGTSVSDEIGQKANTRLFLTTRSRDSLSLYW